MAETVAVILFSLQRDPAKPRTKPTWKPLKTSKKKTKRQKEVVEQVSEQEREEEKGRPVTLFSLQRDPAKLRAKPTWKTLKLSNKKKMEAGGNACGCICGRKEEEEANEGQSPQGHIHPFLLSFSLLS